LSFLVFRVTAEQWERWTDEAAASIIGQYVKLQGEDGIRECAIFDAKVIDEGDAVEVTVGEVSSQ
jgi:hypothetical protein